MGPGLQNACENRREVATRSEGRAEVVGAQEECGHRIRKSLEGDVEARPLLGYESLVRFLTPLGGGLDLRARQQGSGDLMAVSQERQAEARCEEGRRQAHREPARAWTGTRSNGAEQDEAQSGGCGVKEERRVRQ